MTELPPWHDSLAFGAPQEGGEEGTIFVLSLLGGYTVRAREGRTVLFGRKRDDVHVPVGVDDERVSRQHGELTYRRGLWWLSNNGKRPIRVRDSRRLTPDEDPVPLEPGYTPVYVQGSRREHLLEVYVCGERDRQPAARPDVTTVSGRTWTLSDTERLVLVLLGRRYLMHEKYPQPLTWQGTADLLAEIHPQDKWDARKVERLVTKVRERLSAAGVEGLTREEHGEPVGNALNDRLISVLVDSTSIVPRDLALLAARLDPT
ncbi:hypothetical protein EV193_107120 [Herbihabitans rhizosphaerae]|uniref:FHA domain-containing protein n=1 Tax=Herbihabitans rhizosphaerae TaxID=1872711 RepID=A0A4Q7KIS4_9PSEU|nr:FHA domain-containing protein [Herbihabitans rhizosphaerae]RZS36439.1 hypothetical protein EV193_107120 [Herbihabitans rhizosphaerae]